MQQTSSLQAIKAQIRLLEQQASELEWSSKPGISQLKTVISRYKLGKDDIAFAIKQCETGTGRKRGVPKGTKLKPKYRNPTNPRQTWAGRGMRPKWLLAALRHGKRMEDFEA